ncbi:MAG: hypothetical protein KatS3mg060_2833 [Dehalococcoidia bacterium]|nr:MAG: hypothetical protein KatS3mg060_2833 [Dehalococcoidia bacterium]
MTVAIVGAGIAGLVAGDVLSRAGVPTVIFEAASQPGGRLATRRIGNDGADSGAQFFTVRDPRFQALVDEWLRKDLVFCWSNGFSDGRSAPFDGYPRYAARQGMGALAERLASSLDVQLAQRVSEIAPDGDRWRIHLVDGHVTAATGVLLTPPLPEALPLVATAIPPAIWRRLAAIRYRRTLSAIVAVEASVLPHPGAVQRPSARLAFVADNQRKGLATSPLLTIHASPDWSDALWPLADDAVLGKLIDEARPYFRGRSGASVLDRWAFALPETVLPERFVAVGSLIFAGDAFAGPRVEGAVLSGIAAGERLASLLPSSGA